MTHTPATLAIQRKLDRWELQHLRLLAAQQAEQIDELQRRLSWAEDCAERWRDDALDLQHQLADDTGGQPGLTRGGRLVVVAAPQASVAVPAIGQPWPGIAGSLYAGIAAAQGEQPDGHIVLLPDQPDQSMAWAAAVAWAAGLDGDARLPTRAESALLYANLRDTIEPGWHWTGEALDGSYAWGQYFNNGSQDHDHKSYEGRCRAVRRFAAQSFDPSKAAAEATA